MYVDNIVINDKKGREIIIRSAEEKDAQDLIDFLKIVSSETPFLIRDPDEVTLSVEQEKDFINAKKDSESELLMVAEIDGRHIGTCSLMSLGGFKRHRHRCDVAIALYKEYCGCGIGRLVLETVLNIAKKTGYEQAELEVITSNKSAVALYEKLGFKIYGTFPDNMKYADGTYADAYYMMKKLQV